MSKIWTFLAVVCLGIGLLFPASVAAEEKQAEVYLYINVWHKRIYLKNAQGEILATYRIAMGAKDTPSPVGMFRVIQKSKDWGGGFGSRWLGLNVSWGIYGIHGTNKPESIGRFVSHGCFRMKNGDIEKLYPQVPLGATVIIDGPIMGHEDLTYRILVPGTRGALVQLVQNRLKAGGYYNGTVHGKFDRQTELAVILFQTKEGLPVTGQIQLQDLQYLGIVD
jgi:hypothetical protein